MKNFKITAVEDGKEYWISRSMAVAVLILHNDHILAVKRGKGAADNRGKWCLPCGYVDFDETLLQAAERELFEETGLISQEGVLRLVGVCDSPREHKQNVTFIFKGEPFIRPRFDTPKGGERGEIEQIEWIHVKELDNYEWAFDHDKRIKSLI